MEEIMVSTVPTIWGDIRYTRGVSWPYVIDGAYQLTNGTIVAVFIPTSVDSDGRMAILVTYPDKTKFFTKDHTLSEVLERVSSQYH